MPTTLSTPDAFWQQPVTKQLQQQLKQFNPSQRFLVACSGGRDSLSLAYALHLLRPECVRVVHINHQLQQPSDNWAKWLLAQCQQWQLPCQVSNVVVESGNVEAQARKARYTALFDALQPDEILVLGHHQQDQAETVFLRLLSGSGVVGLSAMEVLETRQLPLLKHHHNQQQDQQHIQLWRPLLSSSRQHITQLAQLICPDYIDDPANELENFDRVFLRQKIWPLLNARWPSMDNSIGRTATLMQDCADILNDVVHMDWQRCVEQSNQESLNSSVMSLTELVQLSIARQRLLLSRWMQGREQYAPAFHLVAQLRDQLIEARQDANPKIVWQRWQFRRYQQQLFRLPYPLAVAVDLEVKWQLDDTIELPSGRWQWQQKAFGLAAKMSLQPWQLKARQGGEVLHLLGRSGQWPLKKTLQNANLAPWQREQIHILYIQDQLMGVFTAQGFWVNQFWVNQVQNVNQDCGLEHFWVKDGWLPCLVAQPKL